jgi:hypothetical protein
MVKPVDRVHGSWTSVAVRSMVDQGRPGPCGAWELTGKSQRGSGRPDRAGEGLTGARMAMERWHDGCSISPREQRKVRESSRARGAGCSRVRLACYKGWGRVGEAATSGNWRRLMSLMPLMAGRG